MDQVTYDKHSEKLIPADVRIIASSLVPSCITNQRVNEFELPKCCDSIMDTGSITTAFLNVVQPVNDAPEEELSWESLLRKMKLSMSRENHITEFHPILSSSRPFEIFDWFNLTPKSPIEKEVDSVSHAEKLPETGVARAVLIGINYVGQDGKLSQSHDNVKRMKKYLQEAHGLKDNNIVVLLDSDNGSLWSNFRFPSKKNITRAFQELANLSQPGDTAFVYFSGYGGSLPSYNPPKLDGTQEQRNTGCNRMTLVPADLQLVGQMRDREIFANLIGAMQQGVTLTCLIDCCYSGTVIKLPYTFNEEPDGSYEYCKNESIIDFMSGVEVNSLEESLIMFSDHSVNMHVLKEALACAISLIIYICVLPFTLGKMSMKRHEVSVLLVVIVSVIMFEVHVLSDYR